MDLSPPEFGERSRLRVLLDHLSVIEDGRETHRVAYPLAELLLLAVCGTIADCDDYDAIAGPADPDAVVRIGLLHAPEPELIDRFAGDGYDLVLAGHTHGGQVRVPFGPAIVTNCGMDVHRARGLHPWNDRTWFHVSAGLGTNPYLQVRFACRPEASLLTLVPRAA